MRDMNRLFNHPTTPTPAIHRFEADARRLADGSLAFIYELRGELSTLQIPPRRDDSRVDGLWQHSCFEAFVAVQGETAYREFNFSPSGQWAAYAFSDYRQAEAFPLSLTPPVINSAFSAEGFMLSARLAPDALPPNSHQRPLRVGLSAVIESRDMLGYWALHHATQRPDFHHPESFILILP